MRQVTINLYKFNELSEEAKNKARDWFLYEYLHGETVKEYKMLSIGIQNALDEMYLNRKFEFTSKGNRCEVDN